MDYVEYPYKPKPGKMFAAFFFFGAGTIILAHRALTNDRGLVLNGIIHFDIDGATTFYWCITALSGAMAGLGLMLVLIGLTSNQTLSLSDEELSAPKWLLSPSNTIVPLSSILRLELKSVRNLHFLSVHHRGGKLTIQAQKLPDADAFAEVCARLADHHLGPSESL